MPQGNMRCREKISIDALHAIAHNKVMVNDKLTVVTRRFNFTTQSKQKNAENLLLLRSKDLEKAHIEN